MEMLGLATVMAHPPPRAASTHPGPAARVPIGVREGASVHDGELLGLNVLLQHFLPVSYGEEGQESVSGIIWSDCGRQIRGTASTHRP